MATPDDIKLVEEKNQKPPPTEIKDVADRPVFKGYIDTKLLTLTSQDGSHSFKIRKISECTDQHGIIHNLSKIATKLLRASDLPKIGEIQMKQFIDERFYKEYASFSEVIAISHKWSDASHPDHEGKQYEELISYLRRHDKLRPEIGLFYDYICLPQKAIRDGVIIPRTNDEEREFKIGLNEMSFIYACADTILILEDNFDKYEMSSWCQFESTIGQIIGNVRMTHTATIKTSSFRIGMSSGEARRQVDMLIDSTIASNGTDKEYLRKKMIEFLSRDLQALDRIRACDADMYDLSIDLSHSTFWSFKCGEPKMTTQGALPMDQEDTTSLIDAAKSTSCVHPFCLLKVTGKLLLSPILCVCILCCQQQLQNLCKSICSDCDADHETLRRKMKDKGIIYHPFGSEVMTKRSYKHLIEYNLHPKNIDQLTYGEIREIYGGFDNFINHHRSAKIHHKLARDLIIINAIDFKISDIILNKQIMN